MDSIVTRPWDGTVLKLTEEKFDRKLPWSAVCKYIYLSIGRYWYLANYSDLVEIQQHFTVSQKLYTYIVEKTPLDVIVATHKLKYTEELARRIPYGLYQKVSSVVTVDDMDYIRHFGWVRWCCKKIPADLRLIGDVVEIPRRSEYIKKTDVTRLLAISSTSMIEVVNQIEYGDYDTVCDDKTAACMWKGPTSGPEAEWYRQHREFIELYGWYEWCGYILACEYDIFLSQSDVNFFIEAPKLLLIRGSQSRRNTC